MNKKREKAQRIHARIEAAGVVRFPLPVIMPMLIEILKVLFQWIIDCLGPKPTPEAIRGFAFSVSNDRTGDNARHRARIEKRVRTKLRKENPTDYEVQVIVDSILAEGKHSSASEYKTMLAERDDEE